MTGKVALEAVRLFLDVIDRVEQGDVDAARSLKEFLPHQTYLSLVREAERAKDEAKFGGRGESDGG